MGRLPAIALGVLAFLFFSFGGLSALGAEPGTEPGPEKDDVQKRLEALEQSYAELATQVAEQQGGLKTFLNETLRFGGFYEPSVLGVTGPDTDAQIASTQNILGLNIAAEFNERIRFVSQLLTGLSIPLANPQGDPRAAMIGQPARREFSGLQFGAVLSQGYLEYVLTDRISLQGGIGYVPFGQALQQRELVLFHRRGGPQLLRTRDLVSPLWSGVHLHGATNIRSSRAGFNLYTSTPITKPRVPTFGTRLWWAAPGETVVLGASGQFGIRGDESFQSLGTDVRLRFGPMLLTTELARSLMTGNDPWSVYVEPAVVVSDEFLVFAFGDYAENTLNQTGTGMAATPDPVLKWEYGGGVNWLPTSFTRIRVGFTLHDYVGASSRPSGQERDFKSLDFSAGVAF